LNQDSKSEPVSTRLKERFKEATRNAILEAAEEVFARDGIARARVDRIAARAGVSVGSVYNHVGDRDALFAATLALRRAEILEALERAVDEAKGEGPRIELERLAHAVLDRVDRHRGFFAIVLESADGPKRTTKPSETVAALQAHVDAVVRRAIRRGTMRGDLADHHTVLFVGMLRAAIRERVAHPEGPSPEAWARSLVALFFDGAAKGPRR
jgi:AcrR family transcriptional regulator